MKKYFILFLSVAFLAVGCTDDKTDPDPGPDPGGQTDPDPDPDPEPEENIYKTGEDLSSSFFIDWDIQPDDDYSFLGYGYDATGKFAHPVSVRKKILNMACYDEDYPRYLVVMPSPSNGPDYYLWGDEAECRGDLATHANFTEGDITKYKNFFRETVTPGFENDNVFPELQYTYFGYSRRITSYTMRFLWTSTHDPGKYITDEFRVDIESLPANEIIETYGTHMIKGIFTGSRVDFVYRSTSTDLADIRSWCTYYIDYFFEFGEVPPEPEDLEPALKDNLYVEFVDNSKPDPNAYMIDILNYEGGRLKFEGMDVTREENATLVGFSERLVPIYELVADPVKRQEIQEAFEEYLGVL